MGLCALNFTVDRGLTTYEAAGIASDRRLDPGNPKDVRLVWKKLRRDPKANIEFAAMNLLAAADEVIGKTDFSQMSAEELKLVLTRYNANVHHVTPYGERAYEKYREYLVADERNLTPNAQA